MSARTQWLPSIEGRKVSEGPVPRFGIGPGRIRLPALETELAGEGRVTIAVQWVAAGDPLDGISINQSFDEGQGAAAAMAEIDAAWVVLRASLAERLEGRLK